MPRNAEEYWAAVVASGWVATIPPKARRSYRQQITKAFAQDPRRVFMVLGHGVPWPIASARDYPRVLKAFAAASRKVFAPTSIKASVSPRPKSAFDAATIAFRFKGQQFERRIRHDYSDDVLDLANDSLKAVGVAERFFWLPASDETDGGVVFAAPEVHEEALRMGLIPEDYDWFETDWYLEPPRLRRSRRQARGRPTRR